MLKILAFLTKRQDLETRAFIEHYETKHIPLIRSLAPAPLVYKRSYLVRGDALNLDDGSIDFDVVTELVFADRDAYLAWTAAVFRPGAGEQVVADEARFLDRARTRAFVVDEFVTAEQALPVASDGKVEAAR
jgi:EthD domain-containing protein